MTMWRSCRSAPERRARSSRWISEGPDTDLTLDHWAHARGLGTLIVTEYSAGIAERLPQLFPRDELQLQLLHITRVLALRFPYQLEVQLRSHDCALR